MSELRQFLQDEAARLGVHLSAEQCDQFALLQTVLTRENEKYNLTRITDPRQIIIRHFLDSLSCFQVTGDLSGKKVIDVGTGAGFPGLALRIAFPQMALTLTDSVGKKVNFVRLVLQELGFNNVTAVAERAETLGQSPVYRERFDWAMARAVATTAVLGEYLLPLCKVGGAMLALKGSGAEAETLAAKEGLKRLGANRPSFFPVHLPEREEPHYLVLVPKGRPTPSAYPRKPGIPSKTPLT